MKYTVTILVVELIVLLIYLFFYQKFTDKHMKVFLPLLILTNIVEWGNAFKLFTYKHSNNWIYTIFNPIEFIFYAYLFYHIITNTSKKKFIFFSVIVLVLFYLVDAIWIQGIIYFNTYAYLLGCALVIGWVFFYLHQLMNTNNNFKLLHHSYFWLCVGLLLFYAGEFLLFAFFEYFLYKKEFKFFLPTFRFGAVVVNLILYTCLVLVFYYTPKKPK